MESLKWEMFKNGNVVFCSIDKNEISSIHNFFKRNLTMPVFIVPFMLYQRSVTISSAWLN